MGGCNFAARELVKNFDQFGKYYVMKKKEIIKIEQVEGKILMLRGVRVIIDADVAALYGVETREINQAVKNNPKKFPKGYVITTNHEDLEVIKNFDHLPTRKFSYAQPKAFTERGLYMLATILKSDTATDTTIAIIEAFAKLRELARTVTELAQTSEPQSQKTLMEKGGDIISDIIGENLETSETESEFELNFAVVKLKHKVKRKKK